MAFFTFRSALSALPSDSLGVANDLADRLLYGALDPLRRSLDTILVQDFLRCKVRKTPAAVIIDPRASIWIHNMNML
jgi:hypothetical protein